MLYIYGESCLENSMYLNLNMHKAQIICSFKGKDSWKSFWKAQKKENSMDEAFLSTYSKSVVTLDVSNFSYKKLLFWFASFYRS